VLVQYIDVSVNKWNHLVFSTIEIRTHKLQHFVVNPMVPDRYLIELDRANDIVNPDFETWKVQDQTLFVWLQSTFFSVVPCSWLFSLV